MTSALHSPFLHLNDSILPRLSTPDYENDTLFYQAQDEAECLYEERQLERSRYEEEGFYDLEVFTHYLSGFGSLSMAIVGLVLNSFCAFTLCRAAVFRSHLVFLCAVAIADALQLSCLIVIITRDIRQPDPRYINLLPRIYIRVFLYLYPLSKFFHLTMAWFVMATTIDCWRWIKKAQIEDEKLQIHAAKRSSGPIKSNSASNFDFIQSDLVKRDEDPTIRCRVIISEILAIAAIAIIALIYTIPAAWENKGDILVMGKIGIDTNCTAFIYHLLQTDLSQTALYRIGYSLLGHLVFQTGIPLVASSIAIAKISRQLQVTSSSLGQLVTNAVQLALHATGMDNNHLSNVPTPTYSQRVIVENRNIIHCSLFLSVFTFYVCHVPQLWAKIQYVNEFVNFMTVANATINGFFILCFCRRHIADGARDIDLCAWCFPSKETNLPVIRKCPSSDMPAHIYREEVDISESLPITMVDSRASEPIFLDNEHRHKLTLLPAENATCSNSLGAGALASSSTDLNKGAALPSAMRHSKVNIATVDEQTGQLSLPIGFLVDINDPYQQQQQHHHPHRDRHRSHHQHYHDRFAKVERRYDNGSDAYNFRGVPQQYFNPGTRDDDVYLAAQV